MRARAERVGGRLTLRSAPGTGTKVVAHFPLSQT
jgi:signal transduction histidine kinase